ncbi:MAG TPA: hypothetical protein OIM43_12810 [Prevotellaceae bacterium]|nr:hypothetical protein [Prevotellaceae bacterium]
MVLTYTEFETLCLTSLTTLFSTHIAVFTLAVTFLLNKKETLRLIIQQIEDGGISLSLSNKVYSAKKYIAKMSYIVKISIWGICTSFIAGIIYILFLFLPHSYWILIILIPIIISGICCVISIIKLLIWYLKK